MKCDVCSKELKDTDVTMNVTASTQPHVSIAILHRRCYVISSSIIKDSIYMGALLNRNDNG